MSSPEQARKPGQGAEIRRVKAGLHEAQVLQPGGQGCKAGQVGQTLLSEAQADLHAGCK